MMNEFAIHSHRTYLDGHLQSATIFIKNGLIHSIQKGKVEFPNCPLEDVGNAVLMPGLIDPHVHINEPGRTDWEGFDTGTKAAAAGGISTLVDMPLNSSPVTTTVNNFQKKIKCHKRKIACQLWFLGRHRSGKCRPFRKYFGKWRFGY